MGNVDMTGVYGENPPAELNNGIHNNLPGPYIDWEEYGYDYAE